MKNQRLLGEQTVLGLILLEFDPQDAYFIGLIKPLIIILAELDQVKVVKATLGIQI